jgi:hypothetical protein
MDNAFKLTSSIIAKLLFQILMSYPFDKAASTLLSKNS